jgi:DNA mismatch repair protein MutH
LSYKHEIRYDESNPISIENYAKKLIGKTFLDIVKDNVIGDTEIYDETELAYSYENKKRKGGLGDLIEECYFHYKCNSDSRPDFDKAGVELKVTPYKINKNKSLSAKERLIITMIDYASVINEKFEESHLWSKGKLILLVYYLYKQDISNRLKYKIDFVELFTPPEQDIKIIKHDYEFIVNKIRAGKAHELSESDTLYLGAAPKAASSKDRRSQPFHEELAMPRAFAYKNSYMTYVLNNYIVPGVTTYESIIKEYTELSFEDYVVNKLKEYNNYSVDDICEKFDFHYKVKPKNLESMLVYQILGIKGNQAEEFVKANVVIKTIRIESDNKIKESMSFPTFKFKEIIKEDWENSTFGNYLNETRFLLVVFKYDDNQVLRLKGCQFWNIPYEDLKEVHSVWEKTKDIIKEGIKVKVVNGRSFNNLPKSSDNRVCHVRPHAQDSNDTYDLPDGNKFPKQCFWLNNTYILEQLDKKFLV